MAISALSSSTLPTGPKSSDSNIQALEAQERSIQKQINALAKNTQLDAQSKAAQLTQLEAELQQLQMAIEQAKLNKAEDHFDRLFATGGEQRLIREQDQWIAPDRLRIVWERSSGLPTVESPAVKASKALPHP